MKKHIFIIVLILVLSTIINVLVVAKANKNSEPAIATTETEQMFYTLGDYKGRIAIFKDDMKKPLKVYDIFTSSLPEEDSRNIKNGIKLTEDEVEKYVYEYIS